MVIPPFLSHLRTDRRGIPVPYINRWGPETTDNLVIQFDRHVKGRAVFCMDQDQTVPDFKAQNIQRQREVTIVGLCQVCGRPVPASRRFLVLADLSTMTVESAGPMKGTAAVIEPWLDERCARFALEHCPALIRRTRDEHLSMYRVPPGKSRITTTMGWLDGPLEAETKARPVALLTRIHLTALDLILVQSPA